MQSFLQIHIFRKYAILYNFDLYTCTFPTVKWNNHESFIISCWSVLSVFLSVTLLVFLGCMRQLIMCYRPRPDCCPLLATHCAQGVSWSSMGPVRTCAGDHCASCSQMLTVQRVSAWQTYPITAAASSARGRLMATPVIELEERWEHLSQWCTRVNEWRS